MSEERAVRFTFDEPAFDLTGGPRCYSAIVGSNGRTLVRFALGPSRQHALPAPAGQRVERISCSAISACKCYESIGTAASKAGAPVLLRLDLDLGRDRVDPVMRIV